MVSFNCSSSSEKNGKKHLKENSSNPSLKRIKMTNHNYLNLWSVNDCGKTYLRHNKSFVQLALVLGFYERDLAWIKRNILPSFNILKYLERTANHHSGANARYLIVNCNLKWGHWRSLKWLAYIILFRIFTRLRVHPPPLFFSLS